MSALVRGALLLALATGAGAKPASPVRALPPAAVLERYETALATLKRPKTVSFEYVVEQLGLRNIEQRHRVYRNGHSERDETVVVNGSTLSRPSVRIFANREYRYDVAALAPRAAAYSFLPAGKVGGSNGYTYLFKTQRHGLGQYAIDEIAIDGRSFLPAIVRFKLAGNGARGRGELRFGQSDVYWVVRQALVKVRLSSGALANERITWLNYQFPSSLPPSTFESPRVVATPEPTPL